MSRLSVLTDTNGDSQDGLLSVLDTVHANAPTSSPAIPATLAIAWATSAPFHSVSQCMYLARRKYGEALVSLQNALRDPYLAKEDGTLFAVLLMGWIEVRYLLVSEESVGSHIWEQNMTATFHSTPDHSKHTNGAIMLVNLRGRQNLTNVTARRLFSFVQTNLVCGSLTKVNPVAPYSCRLSILSV